MIFLVGRGNPSVKVFVLRYIPLSNYLGESFVIIAEKRSPYD